MFLCRFDISFFDYVIDFGQNFEWDKFWGLERIFGLVSDTYQ